VLRQSDQAFPKCDRINPASRSRMRKVAPVGNMLAQSLLDATAEKNDCRRPARLSLERKDASLRRRRSLRGGHVCEGHRDL